MHWISTTTADFCDLPIALTQGFCQTELSCGATSRSDVRVTKGVEENVTTKVHLETDKTNLLKTSFLDNVCKVGEAKQVRPHRLVVELAMLRSVELPSRLRVAAQKPRGAAAPAASPRGSHRSGAAASCRQMETVGAAAQQVGLRSGSFALC